MADKENAPNQVVTAAFHLGRLPTTIPVSFGRVLVGEEKRIQIVLEKDDACISKLSVERFPGDPAMNLRGNKAILPSTKDSLGLSMAIDRIMLGPMEKSTLIIKWKPVKPASMKEAIVLKHQTNKGTESIRFLATGVGLNLKPTTSNKFGAPRMIETGPTEAVTSTEAAKEALVRVVPKRLPLSLIKQERALVRWFNYILYNRPNLFGFPVELNLAHIQASLSVLWTSAEPDRKSVV